MKDEDTKTERTDTGLLSYYNANIATTSTHLMLLNARSVGHLLVKQSLWGHHGLNGSKNLAKGTGESVLIVKRFTLTSWNLMVAAP
jgi:hypothetical protein